MGVPVEDDVDRQRISIALHWPLIRRTNVARLSAV